MKKQIADLLGAEAEGLLKHKATGFQCRLKRKGHGAKDFRKCSSPKTYKHLKAGRYTFTVRANGPGGKDPSPAKKNFKIK